MAIFHASLKTLSRARGDSAVAAAAYRAGCSLTDERIGLTHDFRNKGGVERVRFLLPAHAPAWAVDAARLWNATEAAEVRSNARVARELIVGLPHELDALARTQLAEDIGRTLVDRYGAAVMVAIHAPDKRGDQRNHHAHILFSTRQLGPAGFGKKIRQLDDREQGPREVDALRRAVSDLTNERLAAAGLAVRVDPRTLSAQARDAEGVGAFEEAARLTREPTEHVGRSGIALARRGGQDERVVANAARVGENEAALATYLERARSEGRLLAPASDGRPVVRTRRGVKRAHEAVGTVLGGPTRRTRAVGQDAALLNAQATTAEEGVRVAREESQAYLDGLRHTAERHAAVVDAYLAVAGRTGQRETLLDQCAKDPEMPQLLRQSTTARRKLRELSLEMPARRRGYGSAMAATAAEQRRLDEVVAERPAGWRVLSRREWAEKRREQRARVAAALQTEAAARKGVGTGAASRLKAEGDALKAEIRGLEKERRERTNRPELGVASTDVRTALQRTAPALSSVLEQRNDEPTIRRRRRRH